MKFTPKARGENSIRALRRRDEWKRERERERESETETHGGGQAEPRQDRIGAERRALTENYRRARR